MLCGGHARTARMHKIESTAAKDGQSPSIRKCECLGERWTVSRDRLRRKPSCSSNPSLTLSQGRAQRSSVAVVTAPSYCTMPSQAHATRPFGARAREGHSGAICSCRDCCPATKPIPVAMHGTDRSTARTWEQSRDSGVRV